MGKFSQNFHTIVESALNTIFNANLSINRHVWTEAEVDLRRTSRAAENRVSSSFLLTSYLKKGGQDSMAGKNRTAFRVLVDLTTNQFGKVLQLHSEWLAWPLNKRIINSGSSPIRSPASSTHFLIYVFIYCDSLSKKINLKKWSLCADSPFSNFTLTQSARG